MLVLSQFTGAARELTEALIVNPYDLRQASDALAAALRMSPAEQRERMRSMRRLLSRSSTSTAGPVACWSTRPSCAAASGCRAGSRPREPG